MNSTVIAYLWSQRRKIAVGLGLLLLCGFFFGLGRLMASERVEYRERLRVMTVVKERIVLKEQQLTISDREKTKTGKTTKKVVEIDRPDGTKERTTEEATEDTEVEKQIEIRYVDRVVEKQVDVVKEVEKEVLKIVEKPLPDWRVSAIVGVSTPDILQNGLSDRSLVLGVDAQRRIAGPLSGGIWGMSNGAVGLSLSLEF